MCFLVDVRKYDTCVVLFILLLKKYDDVVVAW
jgi:hypothetical protein